MQIKNYELRGFVEFLLKLEGVKPKLSRMRVRFAKLAQAHLAQVEDERIEIAKQFSKRDEKGNIVTNTDENGVETVELSDVAGFQIAFRELMEEEFYIEESQEHKDMLLGVKELVLETDTLIGGGQEALEYDRWCEIVEGINY